MQRCPKCGRYMDWYLEYRCGVPYADWNCPKCGYDTKFIRTFATANTVINKIARWIDVDPKGDDGLCYYCSECGSLSCNETNFCPNCGLKMEAAE